jgi:hypothetical protein
VCAITAISKSWEASSPAFEDWVDVVNLVEREVGIDPEVSYLGAWNDAQRDKRKVIRALRRTARKVRSGEIALT